MDLDEMLRVDMCRDMGELIKFCARSGLVRMSEPGCFLRYRIALQYAEFYVGKIRRIRIDRCSDA